MNTPENIRNTIWKLAPCIRVFVPVMIRSKAKIFCSVPDFVGLLSIDSTDCSFNIYHYLNYPPAFPLSLMALRLVQVHYLLPEIFRMLAACFLIRDSFVDFLRFPVEDLFLFPVLLLLFFAIL